MPNKFDQLVEDLNSGELTITLIQIAYRAHLRQNKNLPEETKSILCGDGPTNSGLVARHFSLLDQLIGGMELAVRRAKD